MNAKELQIGDWVSYTEQCYQDKIIALDSLNHLVGFRKSHLSVDWCDLDQCSPIPLTEEILKTNGFKEVYKSTFQTIYILQLPMGGDFLEYVFLACSDNCFKIFLYGVEREKTYINNVHQLQQALRLCGLNDLADNFKV